MGTPGTLCRHLSKLTIVDEIRDVVYILDNYIHTGSHLLQPLPHCFHLQLPSTNNPYTMQNNKNKSNSNNSNNRSLVFCKLDYCNTVLAGFPRHTIAPLQQVQNAAAHVVACLGPRNHVTPTLKDRHWLPIEQRIVFKLCLLMHQVHTGRAPSYLRSCVTASADMTSSPRLRSTSSQHTRLTFGELVS